VTRELALSRNENALREGAHARRQDRIEIHSDAVILGRASLRSVKIASVQDAADGVRVRAQLEINPVGRVDLALVSETACLMSLYLACRITVPEKWRWLDNCPVASLAAPVRILPSAVGGTRRLDGFADWLSKVTRMGGKRQEALRDAAERYRAALWEAESHFELAYLDLVTAVEAVARLTQSDTSQWESSFPELSSLAKRTRNTKLITELGCAQEKLAEQSCLRRKFTDFLCNRADDGFWAGRDAVEMGPNTRAEFRHRIDMVYRVRSSRLHEGLWLDPSVTVEEFEFESARDRFWSNKDRIPSLNFFAQLVGHALRSYPQACCPRTEDSHPVR
jgi:hypothetical protein